MKTPTNTTPLFNAILKTLSIKTAIDDSISTLGFKPTKNNAILSLFKLPSL
ncbi:hypothetical protein [Flavobacterium sp. NKUCC04_CG]|uniref:hypothetical protein n=1 Tax=Flavobacterium sp. NKUCC04_CG TaxID=2842121 RepID=UPI001C5A7716|nr:hypothetical protein [Flavobacterium sp. NKUCC04_CG]MBW3518066.1 hypothetical protein [Flavobacterium sp. NKUCC04_CG]